MSFESITVHRILKKTCLYMYVYGRAYVRVRVCGRESESILHIHTDFRESKQINVWLYIKEEGTEWGL